MCPTQGPLDRAEQPEKEVSSSERTGTRLDKALAEVERLHKELEEASAFLGSPRLHLSRKVIRDPCARACRNGSITSMVQD